MSTLPKSSRRSADADPIDTPTPKRKKPTVSATSPSTPISTSASTSTSTPTSTAPFVTRGRVEIYSRRDKVASSYRCFNVTSKSRDPKTRIFSPFHLGPIDWIEPLNDAQKYTSQNMENGWQYLKRFKEHKSNEQWLTWAQKGWNQKQAVRFPMGKKSKPQYSYWKGQQLSYIEARIRIYAPMYAWCVEKYAAPELQELRALHESGVDIALFDFDGYAYLDNNRTLFQCIYNPKRKMGHAFVLAGLITGNRFWETEYDETLVEAFTAKVAKR